MFFVNSGMNLFAFIFIGVVLVCFVYVFAGAVRGFRRDRFEDERPHGRGRPDDWSGSASEQWQCDHADCQAINPPQARFCRMCGRPYD